MFFNPPILRRPVLVTVGVLYYMPDFQHIVNEFIWKMEDYVPEMERVKRYLDHWKTEIDAVVKEVKVAVCDENLGYRRAVLEMRT